MYNTVLQVSTNRLHADFDVSIYCRAFRKHVCTVYTVRIMNAFGIFVVNFSSRFLILFSVLFNLFSFISSFVSLNAVKNGFFTFDSNENHI